MFRQKPMRWHIAGEHRQHLSSYLYDAAAVVVPVAQAFHTAGSFPRSHPFVFCPGELPPATVQQAFTDTSVWGCEG